jgi:hypothetical protein
MNRRNKITLICTLAAITAVGLTWTRAQTPPGGDMYGGEEMYGGMDESGYGAAGGEGLGGYDGGMMSPGMMPGGMPGMPSMGYGMGGPGTELPAGRELKARMEPLLQRLRDAADDQQKEAIKRQLSSLLEDYFQRDLQWRSSEIDSIEQRVKRLREQLEQRQQAKDEILQLQLKVLENETAGLGFFSRRHAPSGFGGGPMMGMGMEGYDGMGLGGMDLGTPLSRVPQAFTKRTSVDFLNTRLDDALDFLRDVTDANIYVDQHALKKAEIDPDASVSMTLKDVSVKTVLELIADSLSASLGVRYEDGIAVIGTHISQSPPLRILWGADGTQPSQQTVKRLDQSFAVYDFIETPLSEVLDYFSEMAGVDIFVNERTLDQASISVNAPVTMNLRDVRPRTALRLILDSVDKSLFFSVVDGVVVVSALKQAK